MRTKNLIIIAALFVASLPAGAQAESWQIDVTLTYLNDQKRLIEGMPVMSVVVPVGSCVEGVTRTETMIPKPGKVTQKLCVNRDGEQVKLTGWVFAPKRVLDYGFKAEQGAGGLGELNYGKPVLSSVVGTSIT